MSTLRNRFADVWHYIAIFLNLALWLVWALRIQNGYSLIANYAFATIAIVAIARVASAAAVGWLDRALHVDSGFVRRYPNVEALANRYRSALRGTVSTIISLVALIVLLKAWGVDALAWFEQGRIGASVASKFSAVAVAIAVAIVVWETCNGAMERQLARLAREGHYVRAARLRTVLPMLRTTLILTILTVFGLTALSEIGVNIAPLLAGAGIVGIAVGFGSQKLVQDVVTGMFLLLENAMQVGDFVTVSGLSGTVENLSIRTIRHRRGGVPPHVARKTRALRFGWRWRRKRLRTLNPRPETVPHPKSRQARKSRRGARYCSVKARSAGRPQGHRQPHSFFRAYPVNADTRYM